MKGREDSCNIMISLEIISQNVVSSGHPPPCGVCMTSWFRSPGVESACRILDSIELFAEVLAHFVEAIEDDAVGLDRIRYGLE
jgi:hypothetical protein